MRHKLLLATLALAQLMVVLDFSIVNVALPSLAIELGLSASASQWVITSYAVALGGTLLLAGRAADLFGRRRMFAWGLAIFAGASLAGGLAPDLGLIVAARALQGLGAALLSPAALSLITTTFDHGADRDRALGVFGAVSAAGFAVGVILGGVVTEAWGWRSVFFVNVPLALLALALTARHVPRSPGQPGVKLDLTGAALITLAMTLLVLTVAGAADPARRAATTALLAMGALASALAFVAVERRARHPLVPLAVIRSPGLRSGMLLIVVIAAVAASTTLVLSLYLQGILGRGPLATGLVFLPAGLGGLLAGVLAPTLLRRASPRRLVAWALLALALSVAALTFIRPTQGAWLVGVAYFASGMGIVTSMFAATVLGTASVRPQEQGLASGLLNTAHEIGAALGVALVVLVVTWRAPHASDPSATTDAFRIALAIMAALSLAAAAWIALRRPPHESAPTLPAPSRDMTSAPQQEGPA